jgi:hypothetical protein
MAGSLQWDEVEKSVKESKRRSGGANRFYLSDGESAEIRLIGVGHGEPHIYKRHYDAKTGAYLVCAEDKAKEGEHEGCVACAVAKGLRGKTARLKSPQRVYGLSVFDPRKYHYVEKKPKGEQYQTCTDDESCRYCNRDMERKINGVRHWTLADNLIMQLRMFEHDTLGKKCAKCDNGKIKVLRYQCPVCEEELEPDDPTEDVRCISCEKELKKKPVLRRAKEIVSCRNCGPKGRRVTLANAWIEVSRSGQRAQTTWNFNVGDVEPFNPDPFIKEFPDAFKGGVEPIDFANHPDFEPLSAAQMAALLDVDNPFGGKSRKKSDDDDDEDDDEDIKPRGKKKRAADDDDDDDDDPPAKKKKKPADDDDDDDNIFD